MENGTYDQPERWNGFVWFGLDNKLDTLRPNLDLIDLETNQNRFRPWWNLTRKKIAEISCMQREREREMIRIGVAGGICIDDPFHSSVSSHLHSLLFHLPLSVRFFIG